MNSPPAPNHPPGKTRNWMLTIGVAFVAIVIGISVNLILPPRWRPQLDFKNTGTNAVTLTYKSHDSVVPPGQSWHTRFSAGDTITIRVGEAAEATAMTVPLPDRNPRPWTLNPIAQRWTAEVNADDPKNIRFENRRFEEITAPPSASEPWP